MAFYLYRLADPQEIELILTGGVIYSSVNNGLTHSLTTKPGFCFFTPESWSKMYNVYDLTLRDLLNLNRVRTVGRNLYRFSVSETTLQPLVEERIYGQYQVSLEPEIDAVDAFSEVHFDRLYLSLFDKIEQWGEAGWRRIG